MLRARKSFAAVPVDCRKTVFFRRGKAGRTVNRILRLAGRGTEEKSGLVLQLVCRRAALMAGKPFLPERKSGTNYRPDFTACEERRGKEVGTNCQPGVIVRDVKRRKTNTMPSETVSEGIEQFYRRQRVTASGRRASFSACSSRCCFSFLPPRAWLLPLWLSVPTCGSVRCVC